MTKSRSLTRRRRRISLVQLMLSVNALRDSRLAVVFLTHDMVQQAELMARISQIETKLNEMSRSQANPSDSSSSFTFQDLSQSFMMPEMPVGYAPGPQVAPVAIFDYDAGGQVPSLSTFEVADTMSC